MGYARALVDAQRYAEATQQLQIVTAEKPDYPEAWLVQGTLQLQDNQDAAAEASLKRYIELAQAQRSGEERSRGLAQAYLSLSRIAEKRKDYAAGRAPGWTRSRIRRTWWPRRHRRASILARQGKMDEARKLLRALPDRTADDAAHEAAGRSAAAARRTSSTRRPTTCWPRPRPSRPSTPTWSTTRPCWPRR